MYAIRSYYGGRQPMATVQRSHVPAGGALAGERRDPVLDARAGRVRCDDSVCREFRGCNADDAAGNLFGIRERNNFV